MRGHEATFVAAAICVIGAALAETMARVVEFGVAAIVLILSHETLVTLPAATSSLSV
jgi:hypothetical protein